MNEQALMLRIKDSYKTKYDQNTTPLLSCLHLNQYYKPVSMQSSAQEVTMLIKLFAAAKDSWACLQTHDMFS